MKSINTIYHLQKVLGASYQMVMKLNVAFMKRKWSYISLVLSGFLFLQSCEDVLDVKSDRYVDAGNYSIGSESDASYAMFGILSKLQNIAENYVILGEVRGDLMDLNANAGIDLTQLNNFTVSKDNKYNNIKDYYGIINNCNMLINSIDTAFVSDGKKVLYKEFAAAKAIRAWTYLQLVLNYKTAFYFEKPLLNTEDALKEYQEVDIFGLANYIEADLTPWVDVETPNYYQIGELSSSYFFIPVRFVLGELYLWTQQYEKAATAYRDLIFKSNCVTNYNYSGNYEPIRSLWLVTSGEFLGIYLRWENIFKEPSYEILSNYGVTSEFGKTCNLVNYSYPINGTINIPDLLFKPSVQSFKNWDSQVYYDNDTNYMNFGDLRGLYGSYGSYQDISIKNGCVSTPGAEYFITKYYLGNSKLKNSELITTCRSGLLYLRYAEAVNRLGKPNLAFAVIKNGLNAAALADTTIVPRKEKGATLPQYMNFNDPRFANNIGMRARGCGYIGKVKSFRIPAANADSIQYVEDQIMLELALETAFEGNRFHDLMRIAKRRNDNSYLANAIAKKHVGNEQYYKTLLSDESKWYLPKN